MKEREGDREERMRERGEEKRQMADYTYNPQNTRVLNSPNKNTGRYCIFIRIFIFLHIQYNSTNDKP